MSSATSAEPKLGHEGRSWGGSDTSDASIACRQIGPIKIKGEIKDGEHVFDERRSVTLLHGSVVRRRGLDGVSGPRF